MSPHRRNTGVWQGHELPPLRGWGKEDVHAREKRAGQDMRQQQNSGMEEFGKAAPLLSNTAVLHGKCDSTGRRLRSSDAVRVKKVWKASITS